MSLYKATCPSGELGNGRIKRPGNGTAYTSASAALHAIEKYKGPESLSVVPVVRPVKGVAESRFKSGARR